MPLRTLVLIPTSAELEVLEPFLASIAGVEMRVCGFGLLEAAIATSREVRRATPDSILLCGLGGTYDGARYPVGEIYCFETVSQYGIGCQRESFLLPADLNFASAPESLPLQPLGEIPCLPRLVSVTSSGTFPAAAIQAVYPDATVEDMEGYGFARGAIDAGTASVSIVRAISNEVGAPFSTWSIQAALQSLGTALQSHFLAAAAN